MMPRTARWVRPPGTPAVRGLAVVLVFFLAGAGLELSVRNLEGVASAGSGGTGGAESRLWVEDPWSHGGGGGAFRDGEKRGSGGGAMWGEGLVAHSASLIRSQRPCAQSVRLGM